MWGSDFSYQDKGLSLGIGFKLNLLSKTGMIHGLHVTLKTAVVLKILL